MGPCTAAGAWILSARGGRIGILCCSFVRAGRGQADLPRQLALRAQRFQHCGCPFPPCICALPSSCLHSGSSTLTARYVPRQLLAQNLHMQGTSTAFTDTSVNFMPSTAPAHDEQYILLQSEMQYKVTLHVTCCSLEMYMLRQLL